MHAAHFARTISGSRLPYLQYGSLAILTSPTKLRSHAKALGRWGRGVQLVRSETPFTLATGLKSYLDTIIARYDIDDLRPAERTALVQVKHQVIDARLEARDYDYADTKVEQQQAATTARNYFEQLEQSVLKASEYDLIGSVEVAMVSANIQKIISLLQ